jgi:anti-sigma B factor antagonist
MSLKITGICGTECDGREGKIFVHRTERNRGNTMSTKLTTLNNLDIAVLEPRGSLIGGEETDEFKAKAKDLIEQGNKKLVLDLGGISYINSSGLGALVGIHSMYQKVTGQIKLCNVAKGVQNVFVITKLTSVFDVEEDRNQAINSLKK